MHGRKIRLVSLDDGYNLEKAVANVKELIEKEQVLSLFGVLGTPANMAIMPIIEKTGVPNFGPASGSDAVRIPFNRKVFHTGPSYADEIDKIIGHQRLRDPLRQEQPPRASLCRTDGDLQGRAFPALTY